MPYCRDCGSEYQEGAIFCQSCGHKLDSISTIFQDTGSPKLEAERWNGKYTYSGFFSSFRRPVTFSAILIFDGNRLSGKIKETNTFLCAEDNRPRYLFSNISGNIEGDIIVFDKEYDGGGNYWHNVNYRGRLDAKNGTISGTWTLPTAKGTFEMSRVAKVLPTCSLLVL